MMFSTWSKLKQKVLPHLPSSDREAMKDLDPSIANPLPEFASLTISPAVDEVLQYPDPVPRKTSKRGRGASQMPRHLTSDQVIQFLAEKKKKKMDEEKAKADRKAAREAKKCERESKKAEKAVLSAACRGRSRGQRGRRTGQRIRNRGRSAQQGALHPVKERIASTVEHRPLSDEETARVERPKQGKRSCTRG